MESTSQSYTMAVVTPEEQTAMASATTVTRSAGGAVGSFVGTALWTTSGPSAPFIVGRTVKIAYDLTLWCMFRRVKLPEEVSGGEEKSTVRIAAGLGERLTCVGTMVPREERTWWKTGYSTRSGCAHWSRRLRRPSSTRTRTMGLRPGDRVQGPWHPVRRPGGTPEGTVAK